MNIFCCEVRLTTIKKKSEAAEILDLLKKQNSSISYFANGSTTKITPCRNEGYRNFFDHTLIVSSNPLLNITVVLSETEAIDQLWKDRKYYNMLGRN